MSAEQNTATARAAYAAFQKGDIPAVLQTMADDVEWVIQGPAEVPTNGTRKGKQSVGEWFGVLGQNVEFHSFEPREFIAQGDKVVILVHAESTNRRTGRRWSSDSVHVATYRDDRLARFEVYADTAAELESWRGG